MVELTKQNYYPISEFFQTIVQEEFYDYLQNTLTHSNISLSENTAYSVNDILKISNTKISDKPLGLINQIKHYLTELNKDNSSYFINNKAPESYHRLN